MHRTIGAFLIYSCRFCGHGHLFPRPAQSEIEKQYQNECSSIENSNAFAMLDAYKTRPGEVRTHYRWYLKRCAKLVNSVKDNISPLSIDAASARIFDAGCSCGVFVKCLMDCGFVNAEGIDVNAVAVRKGIESLGAPITLGNISNLAQEKKYHCIIATTLLEHLSDPLSALAVFKSHLVKGGRLLVTVPNFDSLIRALMGSRWLWYMPPFHIHHFTPQSLRTAAAAQGFTVSKMDTLNTGTYLYLLHALVFGTAKTQRAAKGAISSGMVRRIDSAVRAVLFPLIFVSGLCGKEPYIVGEFTNE